MTHVEVFLEASTCNTYAGIAEGKTELYLQVVQRVHVPDRPLAIQDIDSFHFGCL